MFLVDESAWGDVRGGTLFYYDSTNSAKPIQSAFVDWLGNEYNAKQSARSINSLSGNQANIGRHGYISGDRVSFGQASQEITGLDSGDWYYVSVVDAENVTFHGTKADAVSGANVITLGGSPAGTAEVMRDMQDLLDLSVASADASMVIAWLKANIPSLAGRVQPIALSVWTTLPKQKP